METTENSGKQPLTWSTSSHPLTDLFISWSQTGRFSFAIADDMSSFDA